MITLWLAAWNWIRQIVCYLSTMRVNNWTTDKQLRHLIAPYARFQGRGGMMIIAGGRCACACAMKRNLFRFIWLYGDIHISGTLIRAFTCHTLSAYLTSADCVLRRVRLKPVCSVQSDVYSLIMLFGQDEYKRRKKLATPYCSMSKSNLAIPKKHIKCIINCFVSNIVAL